ncbi:MAG: hypothetical protein WC313_11200 [Candidatus Kapaibacterium sp.]
MKVLYIYIAAILLATTLLNAQDPNISTPLRPAKEKVPTYIGFIAGMGQNFQSGEYYVDCADCIFENGVKAGYTIGIVYDRLIGSGFKYGIAGMLDFSGLSNSFIETELVSFELPGTGVNENIPVRFRHTSDISYSQIIGMPYIKYEPASFFFVRIGLGASYIFGSSLVHDKELIQHQARLSNGMLVSITIPGTNDTKVNIQDSEIRDLNNFQIYLMPAIGFKINFSETTYLQPTLQYNIAMSDLSNQGKDFRIHQWRLLFELGFRL